MASEKTYICCLRIATGASSALAIVGILQVLTSVAFISQFNLLHLVLQLLAGIWAIFTGVVCVMSTSKLQQYYRVMKIVGIRITASLNIFLEISATVLLLMDDAGVSLSPSHHFQSLQFSPLFPSLDNSSKGMVILTGIGSASIFLGLLTIVTTLPCLLRNNSSNSGDVVQLSARWVYRGNPELFIRPPSLRNGKRKKTILINQTDENIEGMPDCEPVKLFALRAKGGFKMYSSKRTESNKCLTACRMKSFQPTAAHQQKSLSTYIRFYDEEDYHFESAVVSEVSKTNSNLAYKASFTSVHSNTPRRTPKSVATPKLPENDGNDRTLNYNMEDASKQVYLCHSCSPAKREPSIKYIKSSPYRPTTDFQSVHSLSCSTSHLYTPSMSSNYESVFSSEKSTRSCQPNMDDMDNMVEIDLTE